jgi:hypothetical protein
MMVPWRGAFLNLLALFMKSGRLVQGGVSMGVSGRFKDLVRRLAVTIFGLVEILGIPRVPEKKDAGKGGGG